MCSFLKCVNIKFGEFFKERIFVEIVNGCNFPEFAKTGERTSCTTCALINKEPDRLRRGG